jgi:hypothetical protein
MLTTILLAAVPVAMMAGVLSWLMLMGARDQERSDAWAERWMQSQQAGAKR